MINVYKLYRIAQEQQKKLPIIAHPEYYSFTRNPNGVWNANLYNQSMQELDQEGFKDYQKVEPEHVSREDVESVHTPEWTQTVMGNPEQAEGIHGSDAWAGGPWDETAQKAVLRSTGGTIRTNEEALKNGIGVHLYDAFHHAFPNKGEGFCTLNDVAIAATRNAKQGKRVMIVDTDVHQGQGTAVCTANNPNIYSLSLHEIHNYPGKKERSSQDVEFENGIIDKEYMQLLSGALDKAINDFGQPDLVMYVAGTDMYKGDQLGHTKVTLEGIQARDQYVFKYFGSMRVPVSVLIPQGYAKDPKDSVTMIKNTIKESQNAFRKYYSK